MKNYVLQLLIAIDQLLNALLGGWADETMSSVTWRKRSNYPFKVFYPIINGIFFNKNHCHAAFLSERDNTQLPPEFRK